MEQNIEMVYQIYRANPLTRNTVEKCKLRAKLIRKLYFEDLDSADNPMLPQLLEDEIKCITERTKLYSPKKDYSESNNPYSDDEFSKITSVLSWKLVMSGKMSVGVISSFYYSVEELFYEGNNWAKYINQYIVRKICNEYTGYVRAKVENMMQLKMELCSICPIIMPRKEEEFIKYEVQMEKVFTAFEEGERTVQINETNIVNISLTLFISFAHDNEMEKANYYLMKAIRYASRANEHYWLIRFLEKEHLQDNKIFD